MLKKILSLFDPSKQILEKFQSVVDEVNTHEKKFKGMSLEEMTERFQTMREEIRILVDKVPEEAKSSLVAPDKTKSLPDYEVAVKDKLKEFMPEAFAMVREMMDQEFNRRHFDVQILAGAILAEGQHLTELRTGEGKTQVFHLPLSLYGLTGRGAHAITVNDYLARRDGEYAGHVLSKLGFTVGIINPESSYKFVPTDQLDKYKDEDEVKSAKNQNVINPGDVQGYNLVKVGKKQAYDCDIVYGTNNEFGFDYLRDNMAKSLERIVQRELYFCIIDEADSVLIDEARTPLIISAPASKSNDLYKRFASLVPNLKKETDYTVDEKAHSVMLTDKGIEKIENLMGVDNLWQDYSLAHHLENALKAHALYEKDKEYLVKNGQVLIVDQFTGRALEGRRYSEGLHQAIEAKEGVEINRESKTLATITFQNFFRLYKVLDGASGTIMTEAEEFHKIYNLESVEVPTNKPVIRKDETDRVYKNREAKFKAVRDEVAKANEKGQPVLVGTTSIDDSEYISQLLDEEGVRHEVLNAKHHQREAKIVANAGKKGSVTVATNMAGRGTDIKLGGQNATKEEYKEIIELGGLYVIGTERHEARRVDNQLRGRSGRQGEPGKSSFFVALDDQIMRIQGGGIVQRIMEMTNIPDDMPIESGVIGNSIGRAQKKMEGHNFDIRKRLVDYDNVMNQQREIFYSRRYQTLEKSENAKGKFIKGRDVILEEDNEKANEKMDSIKKEVREDVIKEVDNAFAEHYFDSREDKKDLKRTIDHLLDLTPDKYLVDEVKKTYKEINTSNIDKKLAEQFKDKPVEEIREFFSDKFKNIVNFKIKSYDKDLPEVYKAVKLDAMDELWTDHVEAMRDLREGIGLRGHAQRDPLVEYKNEGYAQFERFINTIDSRVSKRILKMVKVRKASEANTVIETNTNQISDISEGTREIRDNKDNKKTVRKVVAAENDKFENVGRNDLCPCGSGKKYKKCHGRK